MPFVLIGALVAFNLPIVLVAVFVPFLSHMRRALMDKGADGPIESTSYSRITGLFGAVVLTTFFWAMGNLILWRVATARDQDVDALIDSVWKFFLLGSALFLPYAFNQLRSVFTDRYRANPEPAPPEPAKPVELAKGVTDPTASGVRILKP